MPFDWFKKNRQQTHSRQTRADLHALAARDDTAGLIRLIRDGADPDLREPKQGFTPLHTAVTNDHLESVRVLLENGANPLIADREGVNPFGLATMRGRSPEIIQLLIDYDGVFEMGGHSSPETRPETPDGIPSEPRRINRNEFWREASDDEVIQAILEVDDPNDSGSIYHEHTPLHNASGFDRSAIIVDLLLSRGADPNRPNHNGNTPLHLAAQRSSKPEVIETLLKHGADPNKRNKDGNTPLHSAFRDNTNEEVIKALLELSPNPQARNNLGQTPLELAGQARWMNEHPNIRPVSVDPHIYDLPDSPYVGGNESTPEGHGPSLPEERHETGGLRPRQLLDELDKGIEVYWIGVAHESGDIGENCFYGTYAVMVNQPWSGLDLPQSTLNELSSQHPPLIETARRLLVEEIRSLGGILAVTPVYEANDQWLAEYGWRSRRHSLSTLLPNWDQPGNRPEWMTPEDVEAMREQEGEDEQPDKGEGVYRRRIDSLLAGPYPTTYVVSLIENGPISGVPETQGRCKWCPLADWSASCHELKPGAPIRIAPEWSVISVNGGEIQPGDWMAGR